MRTYIGIMEITPELYHYLCDTSFERAQKLPPNHHERQEFDKMLRKLELSFRNTAWEETNHVHRPSNR